MYYQVNERAKNNVGRYARFPVLDMPDLRCDRSIRKSGISKKQHNWRKTKV